MWNAVKTVVAGALFLLAGTLPVLGQQSTEIFIPIGQSPGVSHKSSLIGTIQSADAPSQTVVVAGDTATWTVTVTDRTKIYLDRSKLRLTSQVGTFGDLVQGRLVEVKWDAAGARGGNADWIKVQIADSGQAQ